MYIHTYITVGWDSVVGIATRYRLDGPGWAPGPVWTDEENLAPAGIRSPDLPARNELLY
jgi:hypothetical protein